MKPWSIAGILVAVAGLLFSSTPCYATWWVDHDITDLDQYEVCDEGEYAHSDYGGPYQAYSYADVWVYIEGEEQYKGAMADAYVYWTDTIMDYDPEWDPPLLATVTSDVYAMAYGQYELEDSDYNAAAVATGYASGYSTSAYVGIVNPEDGDIDTDWFNEHIDIYQNGYPIYLREFAYATAGALTTEDKVKARGYADSETTCVVVQNP